MNNDINRIINFDRKTRSEISNVRKQFSRELRDNEYLKDIDERTSLGNGD